LLVSCSADTVGEVLALFQRHGFDAARVIGVIESSNTPGLRLI
jgi:hypothetical protein